MLTWRGWLTWRERMADLEERMADLEGRMRRRREGQAGQWGREGEDRLHLYVF